VASERKQAILTAPAYPFSEAAHYLNVPLSTIRAWSLGQSYRSAGKAKRFQSLIRMDDPERRALSFLNLVEIHVLGAIRRDHQVSLPSVRRALGFVSKKLNSTRPLAEVQFQTDGVDLFVERLGPVSASLINVSKDGQSEMAEMIRARLERIERNAHGVPIKLYPLTRSGVQATQPAPVVIDPTVAFGRPVLAGRGVPTAVLADRFKAGDSLTQLSEDYDTTPQAIEEAIRCELDRAAA
jgi:uncharacterized protein (DUF433 family)